MTRLFAAICSVMLRAGSMVAFQPPPGQGEFVPVDQLPPADQLPAAPLLIAAYAFAWTAVLFYLWTIWRRLHNIEKDMQALARRSQQR
jgi:CcmD family protein